VKIVAAGFEAKPQETIAAGSEAKPLETVAADFDRAGVPDLLVRWIISIGGGGDSRDPTTNKQVVVP
jgi:hypothetical protein